MKRSHFKLTVWVQPPVWERISQQFTLFCLSYFPYFIFTVTLITPVHNILLNPWSELGNTFKIMSETALKCFVIFVHFHWKKSCLNKKVSWFFFFLKQFPNSGKESTRQLRINCKPGAPHPPSPLQRQNTKMSPKKSGRECERHCLSQHITSGLSYKFLQPFFTLQLQQEFETTESSQTLLLCRNTRGLLKLAPPYNQNITNHGVLSADSNRPGKESKNIFYSSCAKVMLPHKSSVIWNQLLVTHFWTKLLISAHLS